MNKVNVTFEHGDIKIHYEDVQGYTVEPELDNQDNRTGVYELYLLVPNQEFEGLTYIKVMTAKDKDMLETIGLQLLKGRHWKG